RIFGYDRAIKPTIDLVVQRLHPEDRLDFQNVVGRASAEKKQFEHTYRLLLPDGTVKHVHAIAHAVEDASGLCEFVGAVMDVTERKQAEALLAGENSILEMVAKGDSLAQILDTLCRLVEEQTPGVLASVLLVECNHLRHGGAPSLPKAYTEAIDGAAIGPS